MVTRATPLVTYLFIFSFLSQITQAIIWSHLCCILGSVTTLVHSFFDPATILSTDPLIQYTLRNKSLYNSSKWHETKCSYQQYKVSLTFQNVLDFRGCLNLEDLSIAALDKLLDRAFYGIYQAWTVSFQWNIMYNNKEYHTFIFLSDETTSINPYINIQ